MSGKNHNSLEFESKLKLIVILLLSVAILFSVASIVIHYLMPDLKSLPSSKQVASEGSTNHQGGGVSLVIVRNS